MTLEQPPPDQPPAPVGMAWLDPPAWAGSLHGFVEAVLDVAVRRAVEEPLPVHTAADVREAAQAPSGVGLTTFVVPAVARFAGRWSKGVVKLGSRLSFSVKALLQAVLEGDLPEARLRQAAERVRRVKASIFGPDLARPQPIDARAAQARVGTAAHTAVADRIALASITVVDGAPTPPTGRRPQPWK